MAGTLNARWPEQRHPNLTPLPHPTSAAGAITSPILGRGHTPAPRANTTPPGLPAQWAEEEQFWMDGPAFGGRSEPRSNPLRRVQRCVQPRAMQSKTPEGAASEPTGGPFCCRMHRRGAPPCCGALPVRTPSRGWSGARLDSATPSVRARPPARRLTPCRQPLRQARTCPPPTPQLLGRHSVSPPGSGAALRRGLWGHWQCNRPPPRPREASPCTRMRAPAGRPAPRASRAHGGAHCVGRAAGDLSEWAELDQKPVAAANASSTTGGGGRPQKARQASRAAAAAASGRLVAISRWCISKKYTHFPSPGLEGLVLAPRRQQQASSK